MTNRTPQTHEDLLIELHKDAEFEREYRRQEPYYDLANEIIACRRQLGWTQKDLAGRAGTHQSRISKIESAEYDIRLSTLIEIAEALDARVEIRLVRNLEISDEQYQRLLVPPYSTETTRPYPQTRIETHIAVRVAAT